MEILIIVLLLLVNGLFAMYEIALVSSSKARLETMSQKGSKKARHVLTQIAEPEKILSTIQVGITLIGIVSGAFGGVALSDDLRPLFASIPGLEMYAGKLAMITVVGIITYLSLIVGELVPKSIALNNPEKIALFFAPFMSFLSRLTYPFVWMLSISTRFVNKILGFKSGEERPMTQEELRFILHQSSKQGVINKEETDMIKDVFRFTDKRASELMTYRKEVVFINKKQTKDEILDIIKEHKYSKYLLCDGSIDDIIGVVFVKDIIGLVCDGNEFDLTTVAHDPLYIPEGLLANRILELFKNNKTSFGIVVSEYGGMEGILTLHDLTESIFGDMPDENEEAEDHIVKRTDGSLLVDGSMSIDDFMDELGILLYDDIEIQGFTTLSGMAMFFLGSVPKEGEIFNYKNLIFEIVDMDGSRVDKLLVTIK